MDAKPTHQQLTEAWESALEHAGETRRREELDAENLNKVAGLRLKSGLQAGWGTSTFGGSCTCGGHCAS